MAIITITVTMTVMVMVMVRTVIVMLARTGPQLVPPLPTTEGTQGLLYK